MSLPHETEKQIVNSIDGQERAEIAVSEYAVEYDFAHLMVLLCGWHFWLGTRHNKRKTCCCPRRTTPL